jgi:hypothetical protein
MVCAKNYADLTKCRSRMRVKLLTTLFFFDDVFFGDALYNNLLGFVVQKLDEGNVHKTIVKCINKLLTLNKQSVYQSYFTRLTPRHR